MSAGTPEPMTEADRIRDASPIAATYAINQAAGEAARVARAIAYEQTVELPESLVDVQVTREVVGRVESVREGAEVSLATVHYAPELADGQLPQLLNLLCGNASLYPGVRLVDLELPPSVLAAFPGPRLGVSGLRELVGVHGRPLLATALKPRGVGVGVLAGLARDFALGGGDIVKDDQNLAEPFEPFKRRVEACARAVEDANGDTGRRCLYLPHVAGPADELDRRFAFVAELGLAGVLACPMVMGPDTMRALGARHGLALMAHPALSGGLVNGPHHGVAPHVLLGTVFRLAGADISIFPNAGGRFAFTPAQCGQVAAALSAPLGPLAPAWPCPAGGMQFDTLGALCADYGPDSVLLVGGALLGHDADLRAGTRAFLDAIRGRCPGRESPPPPRRTRVAPALAERVFRHDDRFEWSSRPSSPYKDAADLAFKGVRRVELVGRYAERTNADLRYFEVQPGGYSSHERHLHTHLIIAARGTGVLVIGDERCQLNVNDVAYVEPLEAHQLRNESDAPFGFFCVVDHERDRPMPAR